MKSLREQMEIVNAYELVGSYRGAAALCGTTHKTVKRIMNRRHVAEPVRREVVRNTPRCSSWSSSGCAPAMAALAPNASCRPPEQLDTAALRATSDGR